MGEHQSAIYQTVISFALLFKTKFTLISQLFVDNCNIYYGAYTRKPIF